MESRFGTEAAPVRPEFAIAVDGTELDVTAIRDVLEIDIDERVNGHGIAQLMMRNWDPNARTTTHSSGELLAIGARLTVSVGYQSELSEVFSGPITAVVVDFPPESTPVTIIEARTESALMTDPPRSRAFQDQNLSDRFSSIAGDYGLDASISDGEVVESVYDHGSDWDRVLALAQERGWVGYVRDATLLLGPPAEPQEPATLTYGRNIVQLRLTEDHRLRADPVVAAVWDSDALEPVESEADGSGVGYDASPRKDLTAALADGGLPMRQARIQRQAAGDQADADALAAGWARRQQLAHVNGIGMVIGIPKLRCDQWIRLVGTGSRTDGLHYLSRVRHRIGRAGYTTEFTVGLPERLTPRGSSDRQGCGLDGSTVVLGTVVDAEDPDGAGRVKVSVVTAAPEAGEVWARLATLDAGPGHGSVFIPAVGSEVVLGFVGRDAVVLGQLYSVKHPPPLDIDAAVNDRRGFQSPAGHRLVLDDSNDAVIEVTTAGGNTIRLSDGDESITVAEPSGNQIVIDGAGLTMTAASGDIVLSASAGKVKIDASAIEAKASGPSKLESSATLDITASATLGLSGALVNIN